MKTQDVVLIGIVVIGGVWALNRARRAQAALTQVKAVLGPGEPIPLSELNIAPLRLTAGGNLDAYLNKLTPDQRRGLAAYLDAFLTHNNLRGLGPFRDAVVQFNQIWNTSNFLDYAKFGVDAQYSYEKSLIVHDQLGYAQTSDKLPLMGDATWQQLWLGSNLSAVVLAAG